MRYKNQIITLFLSSFILITRYNSFCQTNTSDLARLSEDTNLVNRINNEILIYKNANPQKALELTKRNIKLASKLKTNQAQFKMLLHLAEIYNAMGYRDSASIALKFAETLSNTLNTVSAKSKVAYFKGIFFRRDNNLDSSTFYFVKSLELFNQLKDSLEITRVLLKLGNINAVLQLPKESLDYINQAFSILKFCKDSTLLSDANYTRAVYYNFNGNVDSSYSYFLKALAKCPKNNLIQKDFILGNLGAMSGKKGNLDSAYYYLNKALTIERSLNLTFRFLSTELNIANILYVKGQFDSAEQLLLKNLKAAKNANILEVSRNSSGLLSDIYIQKNDYQSALHYYRLFDEFVDSLKEKNNRKLVLDISTKYETEKKDNQLIKKEAEIAKQLVKIQKQEILKNCFLIGLIVLLVIVIVVYRRNQQKQRTNLELNEKNKKIIDSINYAKLIQDSLLPNETILSNYFDETFIYYQPKDIVSGDFYWLKETASGIVLCLGDSDKNGVPGALMSVLGHNSLDNAYEISPNFSPATILSYLDIYLKQKAISPNGNNLNGMSLSLLDFDKYSKKIRYSSANQCLYFVRNNVLIELKENHFLIGSLQKQQIIEGEEQLQKGDMLYLFSDGYQDQTGGPKKIKFMQSRLKELLIRVSNQSCKEQKLAIKLEIDTWKGSLEQIDDILVLGVRV